IDARTLRADISLRLLTICYSGRPVPRRDLGPSNAFENMQTATPVDKINEAPVIETHVVALHALRAFRDVGHKGSNFFRSMRVRYVNDLQSAWEPRNWNLGAPDFLAELV